MNAGEPLARGEVRLDDATSLPVTILRFDADAFAPAMFEAAALERPATIARSVPRRQAEFFFGRLAARTALAEAGHAVRPVGIGPMREPLWPAPVVGSITHAHGPAPGRALAAAVVADRARCAGVGIDIEVAVADERAAAALAATAVDADELALLRRAWPELSPRRLLTLAFSAKESFYKGVFDAVREFLGFDAVRVRGLDRAGGRLTLGPTRTLHPAFDPQRRCDVGFDWLEPDVVLTSFAWR